MCFDSRRSRFQYAPVGYGACRFDSLFLLRCRELQTNDRRRSDSHCYPWLLQLPAYYHCELWLDYLAAPMRDARARLQIAACTLGIHITRGLIMDCRGSGRESWDPNPCGDRGGS